MNRKKIREEYPKYNTGVAPCGNERLAQTKMDDVFVLPHIITFQHDLCNGYTDRFDGASCIYSEPSWRQGYSWFTKFTIAENTAWKKYITEVKNIVEEMKIPSVILCGKEMLKILKPEKVIPFNFRFHYDCVCYYGVWNIKKDIIVKNEFDMRDWIAKEYDKILDFSCGYGVIARDIINHGKRGILSDINTDCINYIKENYNE